MSDKSRFRLLNISQHDFNVLPEYSRTNPTGTTTGKRWKCNLHDYPKDRHKGPCWIVCEYLAPLPDPQGRPGWHLVPIRYYWPLIR